MNLGWKRGVGTPSPLLYRSRAERVEVRWRVRRTKHERKMKLKKKKKKSEVGREHLLLPSSPQSNRMQQNSRLIQCSRTISFGGCPFVLGAPKPNAFWTVEEYLRGHLLASLLKTLLQLLFIIFYSSWKEV